MSATVVKRRVPVTCECGAETTDYETSTEGDTRLVVWSCRECGTVHHRHLQIRHRVEIHGHGVIGWFWG